MFFNDVAYAMGNAGQSAGGDAFGSPLSMNILLMVVIFAIFYFLIIRPQQQEAKRLKAMLSALKKGDKVITVGGIYGVIVDLKDDTVILDLGDSTVEIGRKYISGVAEGRSSGASKTAERKRKAARKASADAAKADEPAEATDDSPADDSQADDSQADDSPAKEKEDTK